MSSKKTKTLTLSLTDEEDGLKMLIESWSFIWHEPFDAKDTTQSILLEGNTTLSRDDIGKMVSTLKDDKSLVIGESHLKPKFLPSGRVQFVIPYSAKEAFAAALVKVCPGQPDVGTISQEVAKIMQNKVGNPPKPITHVALKDSTGGKRSRGQFLDDAEIYPDINLAPKKPRPNPNLVSEDTPMEDVSPGTTTFYEPAMDEILSHNKPPPKDVKVEKHQDALLQLVCYICILRFKFYETTPLNKEEDKHEDKSPAKHPALKGRGSRVQIGKKGVDTVKTNT